MRILLDENLPGDLAALLVGHQVDTVAGVGWAGIHNGKLLRLAAERYETFVTMDGSIQYQQNYSHWRLGIIVLRARSNRLIHIEPLVPRVLVALHGIRPGQLLSIGS